MDTSQDKIEEARGHLTKALALLDEREFLVEAAFVQTALDRIEETIGALHAQDTHSARIIPLRKS